MVARSVDEFFGCIELRGPPESVISNQYDSNQYKRSEVSTD
jgi:hypothetical protein